MLIDPDHMWLRGLFKPSDMSINYFNQRRRSVCVLMFHASRMSFFISFYLCKYLFEIYTVLIIFFCIYVLGAYWL